jgi:hypothetical protein
LGTAIDSQSGEVVEGYAIVHYKKGQARSAFAKSGSTQCYGFLAKGAKWKTVEPWLMNPGNTQGLDQAALFANFSSNVSKWEDGADGTMGNGFGVDILGFGSSTFQSLVTDTSAPDGMNEVYFGSIADPGAIGVTTVWGIFSGPLPNRKLVEWDMVFDQVDFGWSASGEAGKMDFENIATHELGHAAGLGDLYNFTCSEQTMYGYATEGETKKRDLNSGDIAGINSLY